MSLEVQLDKFLKIKTNGRDDTNSNLINYPYEATPYTVLQELTNSGYITKKDKIVDFGAGKGRVEFYLAYATKAKMIGVEYDIRLYNSALENKKTAISAYKVEFVNENAVTYQIDSDVTGLYFFNPFSLQILKEVIKNTRISKSKDNRKIKLYFYYPSNEYITYLDQEEDIRHIEDLDCRDMFKKLDQREIISIYEL